MRRAGDLITLPVISQSKGEIIGEVDDILFDQLNGEIKIIVIKNKERLYTTVKNLYTIGDDLIVIKDSNLLFKYDGSNIESYVSINNKKDTLIGEQVITSDGKEVGMVKDMIVDESKYKMAGYELSGGIFNDLLKGRNILPIENKIVKGEDAVILENNNLKEI